MFIELPVIFDDSDNDDIQELTTSLLSIDINMIHSFNPASDLNRTSIRTHTPEESWQVDMPYDDFKEMFESIKGKITCFIKPGIEI